MTINDKLEREASLFALFLLMPRDLLMEEIIKLGGLDLSSDTQLLAVCEKFGVTVTALTVRLGLLSKEDKKTLGFL